MFSWRTMITIWNHKFEGENESITLDNLNKLFSVDVLFIGDDLLVKEFSFAFEEYLWRGLKIHLCKREVKGKIFTSLYSLMNQLEDIKRCMSTIDVIQ